METSEIKLLTSFSTFLEVLFGGIFIVIIYKNKNSSEMCILVLDCRCGLDHSPATV